MSEFKDKKVAVLGWALEGRAAADFMLAEGASVSVLEDKPEDQFNFAEIEVFRKKGVVFNFEGAGSVAGFEYVLRSPGMPLTNHWILEANSLEIPITSGTAIFLERAAEQVIGVTGTKGKGTTCSLVYEMLKAGGESTALVGNIGAPALTILPSLKPETRVVYELSSFQLLEVKHSPHIAVVLMVTEDHLDFHGSPEEYALAKANIVKYQNRTDIVIANTDYESSQKIAEGSEAKKIWVSRERELQNGCSIAEGKVVYAKDGVREEIIDIAEIILPGAHNLENVCAAVAVAKELNLPNQAIVSALKTFRGLPHRLELVGEKNGVKFYDDSISTTPESAIAAIQAFSEPKILILGGSHKGADFTELGKLIASDESIRAIIGIGEEWSSIKFAILNAEQLESPPEIIEDCGTMEEVVRAAKGVAQSGDAVILSPACASFDMFKSYKDRGEQFAKAVLQ